MRCAHHRPAAHARAYSSQQAAILGCEPCCEVVRGVRNERGEVIQWGVIPAVVELDQGEGREPVRQPADEFVANWWVELYEQARRERECTEV
jgi:hypothetical protein